MASIQMCCNFVDVHENKIYLQFVEEVLHPRTAEQHPAKKKGIKEFFSPDFGIVHTFLATQNPNSHLNSDFVFCFCENNQFLFVRISHFTFPPAVNFVELFDKSFFVYFFTSNSVNKFSCREIIYSQSPYPVIALFSLENASHPTNNHIHSIRFKFIFTIFFFIIYQKSKWWHHKCVTTATKKKRKS